MACSTAAATTYVWEVDNSEYVKTTLLSTIYGNGPYSSIAFLPDSDRLFIMNNTGLTLYDIKKNSILSQTGCSYNPNLKMYSAVFCLNNRRTLVLENFDNGCFMREWPIFGGVEELVKYLQAEVGNRKIDKDFYENLNDNILR